MKDVRVYTSKNRTYAYHRPTGRRIFNAVGTPEFVKELEAIKAAKEIASPPLPSPGSLGSAFIGLRSHENFRQYSLRCRSNFESVMRWLPDDHLDTSLAAVTVRFAHRLRDRAHRLRGANFANIALAFLQAVIDHAVDVGQLPVNKLTGRVRMIPRSKHPPSSRHRRKLSSSRECASRGLIASRRDVGRDDG